MPSTAPNPIVLGYRGNGWTRATVKVDLRSLAAQEKQISLPLNLQLSTVPDILAYTLEPQESGGLATVWLKEGATLPSDDRALLHVTGGPMADLALGIMGAMTPGIPITKIFKKLDVQIEVRLVPFVLEVVGEDGGRVSQAALDGDKKSKLRLKARVCRVNSRGEVQEEVAANLRCSPDIEPENSGLVTWRQSAEGPTTILELESSRCLGGSTNKRWGTLKVEAEVQGHRLEPLTVPVEVKPLSSTLKVVKPAEGKLILGEVGTAELELEVKNSKGEAVAGVPVGFLADPAWPGLKPPNATTGADGKLSFAYTLEAPEKIRNQFTGPVCAVRLEAHLAEPGADLLGEAHLSVEYRDQVVLSVSKEGFAGLANHKVVLKEPGKVTVSIHTAWKPDGKDALPVHHVTVKEGGKTHNTGSGNQVELERGSGAGTSVSLHLPPNDVVKNIHDKILSGLEGTARGASPGSAVERLDRPVRDFAEKAFLERLADQEEKEYESTALNARMLGAVLRVSEMSRALLQRRFGRLEQDVRAFLKNLAGAIFDWCAGAVAKKLGPKIYDGLVGAFRWAAQKLARFPKLRWAATQPFRLLRWLQGGLESLVEKIRGWIQKWTHGSPQALNDAVPKRPQDGLLPHQPGQLVPYHELGKEATKQVKVATQALTAAEKAVEESAQALARHAEDITKLSPSIAEAERILAEATNDRTRKRWAARLAELNQEKERLGALLRQAEEAGEKARDGLQQARQGLEEANQAAKDLEESCSQLDEILSAIFSFFNRLAAVVAGMVLLWVLKCSKGCRDLLKDYVNKYFPQMGSTFSNCLDDLLWKDLFARLIEGVGGYAAVGILSNRLVHFQLNGNTGAVEAALKRALEWKEIERNLTDPEQDPVRKAFRWYYEEIESNSFKTEGDEIMADAMGDFVNFMKEAITWGARGFVLVSGILSVLFAPETGGATLLAYIAARKAMFELIEKVDGWWDTLKAMLTGVKSMAGVAELAGIVIPSAGVFTARLYDDASVYPEVDGAWNYDLPRLPPELVNALGDAGEKVEQFDQWAVDQGKQAGQWAVDQSMQAGKAVLNGLQDVAKAREAHLEMGGD